MASVKKPNVPQVVRKYLAASYKYYSNHNQIRRMFMDAEKKLQDFKNKKIDAAIIAEAAEEV